MRYRSWRISHLQRIHFPMTPPPFILCFSCTTLSCFAWIGAATFANAESEEKNYANAILPILERYCYDCHADGGTVLIQWDRPEECDGRSTIRWIVSKSGTVLRHRYEAPHC